MPPPRGETGQDLRITDPAFSECPSQITSACRKSRLTLRRLDLGLNDVDAACHFNVRDGMSDLQARIHLDE